MLFNNSLDTWLPHQMLLLLSLFIPRSTFASLPFHHHPYRYQNPRPPYSRTLSAATFSNHNIQQGQDSHNNIEAKREREREREEEEEEVDLGTTLVAIRYDEGVVVAADTRTSVAGYVSHRFANKINRLSNYCVVLRSGSAADSQQLIADGYWFGQSRYYQYGGGPSTTPTATALLSVSQMAHWLRNTLLKQRNNGSSSQLMVGLIVAGYDATSQSGKIFSLFPSGALCEETLFAVSGSGSTYIMAFLDQEVERLLSLKTSTTTITKEQAFVLCRQAIERAIDRDGSSGGMVRLGIVSRDGIQELCFSCGHNNKHANATVLQKWPSNV